MTLASATLRRHRPSTLCSPWLRRLPGAVAALTLLGAATASQAEALAIELPSMRTPIEAVAAPAPAPQWVSSTHAAPHAADVQRQPERTLTRQEVRETLKRARAANIVSPTHEIGDTPDVLAAREAHYALQTEALVAQYAAAQREQALRAALDQDLALRQALLDETIAERAAESGPDADIALAEPTEAADAEVALSEPSDDDASESSLVAASQPAGEAEPEETGHVTAMREHELEVTPDTTVADVMSYLDEVGEVDDSLTLTVAEAGDADEVD